jgi:hypothetical protein
MNQLQQKSSRRIIMCSLKQKLFLFAAGIHPPSKQTSLLQLSTRTIKEKKIWLDCKQGKQ